VSPIKFCTSTTILLALLSGKAMGESPEDIPTLQDQVRIPSEIMEAAHRAKAAATVKPDIQARAAAVMEQVNSEAWQRQKNQFLAAIKNQHGIPEEEQSKTPSTRARPLLFISSSMPEITLRNYARDLEKVKGVMVLRGMIGGMETTQATMKFVAGLLKKNPLCEGPKCALRDIEVVVDPIQFQKHGIHQVPALVVEPSFDFQSYCESGANEMTTPRPVVYGDANLRSLLNSLTNMSDGTSAKALLAAMEMPND